ncbi:hypothetical protein [Azospirillum sp. sgz301742]
MTTITDIEKALRQDRFPPAQAEIMRHAVARLKLGYAMTPQQAGIWGAYGPSARKRCRPRSQRKHFQSKSKATA